MPVDVAPTKLRQTAGRLIGRDEELSRLDAAWNDPSKNVVVRAFGGMGKTSLGTTWMAALASQGWRGAERVFDWTFEPRKLKDSGVEATRLAASSRSTATGAARTTRKTPKPPSAQHLHQSPR